MESFTKKDIEDLDDIKLLVDTFYNNVRKDTLIGPIFDDTLRGHWDQHLTKMYSFWQTVLLGQQSYRGAPFVPHMNLPVDRRHFDSWVQLWEETIDQLFQGQIAVEAKWRAGKMKEVFISKLEYMRAHPQISKKQI